MDFKMAAFLQTTFESFFSNTNVCVSIRFPLNMFFWLQLKVVIGPGIR